METRIKRRSMILQILWCILTLGIYAVYWFYVTSREMVEYRKKEENVMLWTIFFGFPILFFYSYYKQGELFEEMTGGEVNRWLTVILWVVFPPAIWFMVQRKLNRLAATPQPAIA